MKKFRAHHLSTSLGGVTTLALALFLSACSTAGYQVGQREAPVFGPATIAADQAVPANTARAVVYRPASVQSTEPVNVYVNDRFVTSLLPGAFVEVNVCAASARITAVEGDARQSAHTGRMHAAALPVTLGKRSYFEVMPNAGGAKGVRLQAVDGITTNAGALRQQTHALNRSVTC